MKSIIKDLELKDGRSLYVQISDSGRVSLSFDEPNSSVQISLTAKELKSYATIIAEALVDREAQLREELN